MSTRLNAIPLYLLSLALLSGCSSHMPVLDAAEQGDLPKLKALLKEGRSINEHNPRVKFGWTPLIAAIYQSNWNVAHYLIQSGADPNIPDTSGTTPLMWATTSRSGEAVDIVKDLIDHGADVFAKDKMGASVLSYASAQPPRPKILEVVKAAVAEAERRKKGP
jgi:ankyrin repeat protein